MKNTKTQFRLFSIVQWKQEEEYLRKQHKNGWKFTRVVFPGFYHFEKCIPEDVVYQLDFNPDGLAHKDSYVQIFRDCGWEYLKDFVGYSYFRKSVLEMNGDEEIFCDDASRLDMIKRIFKGRIIPLICLFFTCIVPNIYLQGHNNTAEGRVLQGVFIALFILYCILFLAFGWQFWQYRKLVCKQQR
ncbi:MAG: DUF2812 domain-containing protein [Eubacterium sp.]|jgi:hypothetical protein|nr:DUF2812 domain-containing protein [Eubacterium sp.]